MNQYLKQLNKIEFVVTDACTGQCRHCSQGAHKSGGARIDPHVAACAVRQVASVYDIQTVMTFGGEPLLYPEAVEQIMCAATDCRIATRQVITNGYFSQKEARIGEVAERMSACGVNDLLLSVDAFHQETIPLDVVMCFAIQAVRCGIPVRLQPAWLVSPRDDNPYNRKTREILARFVDMNIPTGTGNVIFPEGNARKYLAAYFSDKPPENPYVEDPKNVRCLSFSPNGNVLDGNVYREDILEIIKNYTP